MAGPSLGPLPSTPLEDTLTRSFVPARRSRTKTSSTPFVSSATRLGALLQNATTRPSAEMAGPMLSPFPWPPLLDTLTRSIAPARAALRPRHKTRAGARYTVARLISIPPDALARESVREHSLAGYYYGK